MDFTQTPPGMLALDNMLYLAKVHQDTYIRVKAGASFLSSGTTSLASLLSLPIPLLPHLLLLSSPDRPGEQQPRRQT